MPKLRCGLSSHPKAVASRALRARRRSEKIAAGLPFGRNQWTVHHGMNGSPEYRTWKAMRDRCLSPHSKDYRNYGGRGIGICDSWASFDRFYADMGPRPDGTTLGRLNNDGPYEPSNCEWQTHTAQARNKRTTVVALFRGETKPLADWCDLLGMNYSTVWGRIFKRGWDPERALTEPARATTTHTTEPADALAEGGV
jgi:hypothetical protein